MLHHCTYRQNNVFFYLNLSGNNYLIHVATLLVAGHTLVIHFAESAINFELAVFYTDL